jgi:DNA-binding MarR family transcriptional regulator
MTLHNLPRDPYENTPAFLIHEVTRRLNREFDLRMSALGLTRAQWWALAKLHFDSGVIQSELAAELGFTKAAVGAVLDRLEAKGWIRRRPHPEDRRARLVFLTPAVAPLLEAMRRVAVEMNEDLVAGLNPAQVAEFERMLKRARDNLSVYEGPPADVKPADRPRQAG